MIDFTLPVVPTAQARPKVTVRGKFAHAYKTGNQKANERTLEAWMMGHVPKEPLEGPLRLEFVACLPLGRSDSKKRREAKLSGKELPTKKPDLDNLAKQLKDTMTRMGFWKDDSQVVTLVCCKVYAEHGRWDVRVMQVGKVE